MTIRRLCRILTLLWAIVPAGCSDSAEPDNPEPTLEMLGVTGITRTDAVISARITSHGSTPLEYVRFRYGETGNIDRSEAAGKPTENGAYTLQLTNLKPGTSYSCYIEGGTSTATLRSGTISFTTVPNELPAISSAAVLSSGPVGLIIEFSINDDGGEPISEAGCEVADASSRESFCTYLPSGQLNVGNHRINISGLKRMTTYTITPFASNSIGKAAAEPLSFTTRDGIELKEAGSLSAIFEGCLKVDIERLTVTGPMNGDDFRFIRKLLGAPAIDNSPHIESAVSGLDLTDAVIVGGGDTYDGSRFTVDNEVTTGLLADCSQLRDLLLPATATVMARNAVARCAALEQFTVSASIASLLPSEGCPSLRQIEVSPANGMYASADGVLFNHDMTAILWFPLGKTGSFTLPATITSIGENAFYSTSITGLVIPPSVTSISRGAFAGSALTEITLPDNITNISEGMFQDCASLTTVRLGKGTEFIGDYAFDGAALTDLYVGASIPPYTTSRAFVAGASSITETCTLHVPAASRAVYRNHSKWGKFSKIETF